MDLHISRNMVLVRTSINADPLFVQLSFCQKTSGQIIIKKTQTAPDVEYGGVRSAKMVSRQRANLGAIESLKVDFMNSAVERR